MEQESVKLDMGCGQSAQEGYIRCDIAEEANPDVLMDMEHRWPFEDNSVDEVRCWHVLEHIGEGYSNVWRELYRVLKPGGIVHLAVPHPRHEHFLGDPTHVRAIHPFQFLLFSKKNCEEWKRIGASNSPLATYWGIDFEIVPKSLLFVPDPRWNGIRAPQQQTHDQLRADSELFCGVCKEIEVKLMCIKSTEPKEVAA